MPWKARQVLLGNDGTIYAPKGAVLPDDDPIALKNPNRVVAVNDPSELAVHVPSVKVDVYDEKADDEPDPPGEEDTPDWIV